MRIWQKGLTLTAISAFVVLGGCGGAAKGFSPLAWGGLAYYESGNMFTISMNGTNLRPGPTGVFVGSMSFNRRIFTSINDGNDDELWSMNANGSDPVQLTNNSDDDFRPIVTPDGTKVVFISRRDGNDEIYIMNADGTGQTRLTSSGGSDYFPSISQDGTKIVFRSDRDGNDEIYSIDADGNNETRLTNNAGSDTTPAWSPDGSQILFTSDRDGNAEIYRMNANGSSQTRLTTTNSDDEYHASYNIDGDWIFYYDGSGRIRRINPDGTNRQDITSTAGASKTCTWVY